MKLRLLWALGSLWALSIAATAQTTPADLWKLNGGFGYTRGSYGLPTDTEVYFVPFGAEYSTNDWVAGASTSWLTIKGPAAAVNGIEIVRPTAQAESGIGDTSLSGSYKMLKDPGEWQVSLTGKLKLPTADYSKGLGTGAADYGVQVDLLRTLGVVTPFGSVGYRWLGSHGVYHLENGPFADAGAAFKVADGTSLGAFLDWDDRIAAGAADATQAVAFFFHKLDRNWSANLYALAGFTNASPDWGGGLTILYSF